jgi:hypothetical protein
LRRRHFAFLEGSGYSHTSLSWILPRLGATSAAALCPSAEEAGDDGRSEAGESPSPDTTGRALLLAEEADPGLTGCRR